MFLRCIGLHPTVIITENLLLKRFELSSPKVKRVDSYILYPFTDIINEYDFAVNVDNRSLKKCTFKTQVLIKIDPSKNTFQNFYD